MSKQPSITLLAGPTASGKSALALKMARETGAVILNADSQQLYADLRILTARPSEEDEALAEHRLYGVADGADAWSVGRWSRAVLAELDQAKNRPLIIVGGTGLYFNALTRGLADIPLVPLEVRASAELRFIEQGEAAFRAALAKVDPQAEARISPGDRQRLVRAASVADHTGRPLSDWQGSTSPLLAPGSWDGCVLKPNRAVLYARCDARVDVMIAQGVLQEVERLADRRLPPDLPVMKALGVAELLAVSEGAATFAEGVASLKQATRNYAKRQMTWFRNQLSGWRVA